MKKIYCPTPGAQFDCPYWKNELCTLENPLEDCDDYYAYMGDEEDE